MFAEIIAVGSELLTPFRLDTNSLMLTDRLNRLGIEVRRKVVVGDDRESLDKAIRCALGADGGAGLLILMGGLGPTEDDRTRESLASVLGRRVYLDESVATGLRERFRRRGMEMPEINLRQAMVVDGAVVLENPKGSAPGLWIEDGGRYIALLPGPPHEAEAVFERHCLPRLDRLVPGVPLVTRVLKIAGMFESQVDQVAAPIYRRYENPVTTILASPGEIELHLRATGASEEEARERVDELAGKLKAALGDKVFSENGESLPEVLGRLLLMKHKTLAVAESCTGGMVGERITRIPGSSAYFLGSLVSYSNEAKVNWLEVPRKVIETDGAVSAETARIMAEGVRRRFASDIGLSITGIAGPGGSGTDKPVGLVYLAVADENGHRISERQFPGDRQLVRSQAAQVGLDMVRRRLMQI